MDCSDRGEDVKRGKEPRKGSEKNPHLKGEQRKRCLRGEDTGEAGGEAGMHMIREAMASKHFKQRGASRRPQGCRQLNEVSY